MKFSNAVRNPLPEILELFPVGAEVLLTISNMEKFRVLLKDAGFHCENNEETSRCLDLLVETGLVEMIKRNGLVYIKRKING